MRTEMLIAGTWRAGADGATFPTRDPSSGAVIAQIALGTEADVDDAVNAAATAFESREWAAMPASRRAQLIMRLAELMEQRADELAELETRDQGQPLSSSRGRSIPTAIEHFRYFAGWVTKITGITGPVSIPDVDYRTRREPLGVCALITPWNFPLTILSFKLAPALATGNTVVIKPAEQTPLSTLLLAELVIEAGFPPGVVNVVLGGPKVGQALVNHPLVAKISFTGSTEVGREIGAVAGRQLKRVSLELGGKTPSIVTEQADIDAAVEGNLRGGLANSGQVCAAYSRMYVHRSRTDEFATKLATGAAAMKLGPGLDPASQLGPLVSEEQLRSVDRFVRSGLAEGAQLRTGGERADGELAHGYFYRPTVFSEVTQDMRIAREEIFGPVLSVLSYNDSAELATLANDTDFGLAAVIWTRDIGVAHRLVNRLRVGTVWINMPPLLDAGAAWGGMKSSGIGREMGWEAIVAFTEVKSIWTYLDAGADRAV